MIFVALMIHGSAGSPADPGTSRPFLGGHRVDVRRKRNPAGANLPLIGMWVTLLRVPYRYLVVVIIVICVIGVYSVNYTAFDVGAMMVFECSETTERAGSRRLPVLANVPRSDP